MDSAMILRISSDEAGYQGTGKLNVGSNKGILGGTLCGFPGFVGAGSSLEDPPLTPSLPLVEFISSLFSPLPVAS